MTKIEDESTDIIEENEEGTPVDAEDGTATRCLASISEEECDAKTEEHQDIQIDSSVLDANFEEKDNEVAKAGVKSDSDLETEDEGVAKDENTIGNLRATTIDENAPTAVREEVPFSEEDESVSEKTVLETANDNIPEIFADTRKQSSTIEEIVNGLSAAPKESTGKITDTALSQKSNSEARIAEESAPENFTDELVEDTNLDDTQAQKSQMASHSKAEAAAVQNLMTNSTLEQNESIVSGEHLDQPQKDSLEHQVEEQTVVEPSLDDTTEGKRSSDTEGESLTEPKDLGVQLEDLTKDRTTIPEQKTFTNREEIIDGSTSEPTGLESTIQHTAEDNKECTKSEETDSKAVQPELDETEQVAEHDVIHSENERESSLNADEEVGDAILVVKKADNDLKHPEAEVETPATNSNLAPESKVEVLNEVATEENEININEDKETAVSLPDFKAKFAEEEESMDSSPKEDVQVPHVAKDWIEPGSEIVQIAPQGPAVPEVYTACVKEDKISNSDDQNNLCVVEDLSTINIKSEDILNSTTSVLNNKDVTEHTNGSVNEESSINMDSPTFVDTNKTGSSVELNASSDLIEKEDNVELKPTHASRLKDEADGELDAPLVSKYYTNC